jgi:hypothetical protein
VWASIMINTPIPRSQSMPDRRLTVGSRSLS